MAVTKSTSQPASQQVEYRFTEGGMRTAVFNATSGRLQTFDEQQQLTVYKSWRDYVEEVQGEKVSPKASLADILDQLSMTLGTSELISEKGPEQIMETTTNKTKIANPAPKAEKATKATPKAEKATKPAKKATAASKATGTPKKATKSDSKYVVPTVAEIFAPPESSSIFKMGGDAKLKGVIRRAMAGVIESSKIHKQAFENFSRIKFLNSSGFSDMASFLKKVAKERGIQIK